MNRTSAPPGKGLFFNRAFFPLFWILWTCLLGASLWWGLKQEDHRLFEAARIQAATAFEKDVLYRRWNAMHGGVYVPVSQGTPPNPHLKGPKRDLLTSAGLKLTKVNPAYMTRQVHELGALASGVKGHITSLKPIRPANAPDPWERAALLAMEKGSKEVVAIKPLAGVKFLRFMRPLFVEQSCLACHAEQGYRLGQVRGGISVSVPLEPYEKRFASAKAMVRVIHALLWLAGSALLALFFRHLKSRMRQRSKEEEANIAGERLRVAVATSGAACHQINQPLQAAMTSLEMLVLRMPADDPTRKKLEPILADLERIGQVTRKLTRINDFKTTGYAGDKQILDLDGSSSTDSR